MAKKYTIRKAQEKDVPYIASIMSKRWDISYSQALKDTKEYLAQDKDKAAWVLIYDGNPVGTGLFDSKNEDVSNKYGPWLLLLYIESEHRGNEMGKRLSLARIEHARKCGYKFVYIDTTDAHQYHIKHGWVKVDEVNYHGDRDIIMRHDLTKAFPNTIC